ncbi:flagellin [Fonticella tunisiensis]|uniref:Flagellin n=1 Tax=Fonticella tunisiensis TaxID=1096341 RepID=A0A4R7KMC0_9CLOT|nr:flagellin [Fonticella tunisiensis]TDT57237.1 flagellin [Fonticella tunisiensis]
MIINHNLNAMNAYRQLGINTVNSGKSMEKLSSGLRINRAGDDAAGLAISEKMRAQIRGLDQASRNAQDAVSLVQTAEGGLNETHAILQRMRELAVQAANDTNVTLDRDAIATEISALKDEIDHIAQSTNFNGTNLLNATGSISFQIGSTHNSYDQMSLNLASVQADASTLGVATLTVSSSTFAQASISTIDSAIAKISTSRAYIGSLQNRLEHTITNLNTESENLSAAESRIRDVDMAKEMMQFSKNNILAQAAQAMLAQANQQPQGVLQLLR